VKSKIVPMKPQTS